MGKKKDDDAAADFFGDENVDWLDAESEAFKKGKPGEPLKVADAEGDEADLGEDAGWAETISPPLDADAEISDAPTLVFSSIDTLPPQMSPFAEDAGEDGETDAEAIGDTDVSADAAEEEASDTQGSEDSGEGEAEEEDLAAQTIEPSFEATTSKARSK